MVMWLRVLIWFGALALATAAAVWLARRPGLVTVEWQGWRLDASVGALLVLIAVLSVLIAGSWLFWRWMVAAPGAALDFWGESRRRKGYDAFAQGMAAVAAGDAVEARRQAQRVEKMLDRPVLVRLLSAQAAQLSGDGEGARKHFAAMLEDPQLAFLGERGLLTQAVRAGDRVEALAHAERAFELRPDTGWVTHTLFDMQAHAGQWRKAQATLESGLRRKLVDAERGRILKALLLLERSRESERAGEPVAADEHARAAYALAPERIPVARRYAELLLARGEGRKAARAVERVWASAPHADLAPLYLAGMGASDPLARVPQLSKLAALNPDHVETRLAQAAANLKAKLWGEARRHLAMAEKAQASTRVYRLWADLEEQEFNDGEKVRQRLVQAAETGPDSAWRCSACGHAHDEYLSVCAACGAFGTLNWRPAPIPEPPALAAPSGGVLALGPTAEILPPDRQV
jgi:HemY protein